MPTITRSRTSTPAPERSSNPGPTPSSANPKPPKRWELRADHSVWSTTYWPYADFTGTGRGDPRSNLWADGGPLEKFDNLRSARGDTPGAKAYEKQPALQWLKDRSAPDGHFIPGSTLDEANAERTTGVDLDGDGELHDNFRFDFLDDFQNFGTNGRTDGKMDVWWWGSCDQVAVAGQLFDCPKRSVTVDGVTFTPQDIKGLLTIIADAQGGRTETVGTRTNGAPDRLVLKNGKKIEGELIDLTLADLRTGSFKHGRNNMIVHRGAEGPVRIRTPDGKVQTYPAEEIREVAKEDVESLTPSLFHKTLKLWLRQSRPFAMDHDRGPHVWNDCYDGANIDKTRDVPRDVKPEKLNGENGQYAGGDLCFYTAKLLGDGKTKKTYRYWIEKRAGVDQNSGWLGGPGVNENPDFMWRPTSATASFTGRNPRNPFVTPEMVKDLYEKSIA